jgi:hypothetical protein
MTIGPEFLYLLARVNSEESIYTLCFGLQSNYCSQSVKTGVAMADTVKHSYLTSYFWTWPIIIKHKNLFFNSISAVPDHSGTFSENFTFYFFCGTHLISMWVTITSQPIYSHVIRCLVLSFIKLWKRTQGIHVKVNLHQKVNWSLTQTKQNKFKMAW